MKPSRTPLSCTSIKMYILPISLVILWQLWHRYNRYNGNKWCHLPFLELAALAATIWWPSANFSQTAAQKVVWTDRDGDSGACLTLQHHSLNSYGGHEMVQQHLTQWNVSKQHQFCPKFDGKELNFSPTAAQKVVHLDRDGDPGADLTLTLHLQHHSLDSYGGHEMVQQHLTQWNVSKQHQFFPI